MRERQDWKVLETDKVATVPSGIGVSMQYKHLLQVYIYKVSVGVNTPFSECGDVTNCK